MPKIDTNPEKIQTILTRGVSEVFEREHLQKALASGKELRIKLGFDPTGGNIHIGRAIVLRKLRAFQDLGHKVVFLVGDFTAKIGDPSDKLEKRPHLTDAQIKENLKYYKKQVGKIINLRKAEFHFNSRWLKKLSAADLLGLQHVFTVNQMLARRNFSERLEKQGEIGLYETTYPLLQGYDSVAVKADVELGGFDQLFNLKAGRVIQEHFKMQPQDILMTEMLEGTDGRKMSTSWGNVINISEEPNEMFGKVMSVKDELIEKYFLLCTDLPEVEIKSLSGNPKDKKMRLAKEIVTLYHNADAAEKAAQEFEHIFSNKNVPTDLAEVSVSDHEINLVDLVVEVGFAESKNEARRLIEQGGVRVDDTPQTDPHQTIAIGDGIVLQVGRRRYARVTKR